MLLVICDRGFYIGCIIIDGIRDSKEENGFALYTLSAICYFSSTDQ